MKAVKILLCIITVLAAGAFAATQVYSRMVLDTTPPTITLDADTVTVSVKDDDALLLEGVHARDDRDGDISDRVIISSISKLTGLSSAQINYAVFDSSDNMATATRTVCYTDYKAPKFSLLKPLVYNVGDTISLVGRLVATDSVEGNVTSAIKVVNLNLNNNVEGLYHVTLRVNNRMGDSSEVTLPILIQNRQPGSPVITLTDYLVYIDKDSEFDPKDYYQSLVSNNLEKTRGAYIGMTVSSEVETSVPGTYEVTYSYTNDLGYTANAILTVIVEGEGEAS